MEGKILKDVDKPKFETKEIFYDGYYYNVTDFIKRHPGGEGIMKYFTTRSEDATLHIQQFHSRSIAKVKRIMKSLPHRSQSEPDISVAVNDDQTERERKKALTDDFTKLFLELRDEGLFEPSYFHVVFRILEIFLFGTAGYYIIDSYPKIIAAHGLGCILLAFAQIRAIGVMHEGGHLSLTGNSNVDRLIQTFTFGSFIGISPTYWRRRHAFHHAYTSQVKHDNDFDMRPLLLVNTKVLYDPKKEQNFITRNQLFFAPFVVVLHTAYLQFWKVWKNILKYQVTSDLLAIGIYYFLAWHIGLWKMLVITSMTSIHFAVNTGVNHTHLPVNTKSTHWVEQALCHTANIKPSWWIDWWMFYLNFQIEHHLFPTLPQFRSKFAVDRVKALAKKHGLPYRVLSYKEGVIKMIVNIFNVSKELRNIHKNNIKLN